jgi:DNA-binding PadR family transcriptional regulator
VREGRRPERTVYEITDTGREEFLTWLRELLREPVKEYTQFAAGLSFLPGLLPEEAVALLRERVRRLEEETGEMRSRLDTAMEQLNLPRLFLVEGEHELMLREAELGWVRGLVKEIEAGKLGGLSEWRSLHSEQGPLSSGEDAGE